jgi:uncharacterized membrane protein
MQDERTRMKIIGAVIGTEAGAAFGLLLLGGVRFAPLVTTLLGAATGALGAGPAARLREHLIRRELRRQIKGQSELAG